jgi:hypothetical protein
MIDSVNYNVVKDSIGGQQDFLFCSLDCLRRWFCGIIDKLESDLTWQKAHGRIILEAEERNDK